MIIFGIPVHRKYNRLIIKIVSIVFIIFISVILMSCSKLDFDPTTGIFRYILQQEKK